MFYLYIYFIYIWSFVQAFVPSAIYLCFIYFFLRDLRRKRWYLKLTYVTRKLVQEKILPTKIVIPQIFLGPLQ